MCVKPAQLEPGVRARGDRPRHVVEPEADAADAQSSEDKPSPKPEARPKSEDGKGPGEQNEESAGESAKESGGPGVSAGSSSRSERT